ncbi:imidazole glycerol phosphate synthase subunit HisF [Chitinibacter sp. S2-10]|uniref:imidazole glycerol phosphate synthase subunit HisF n=1 Tax=Chitinibacter sp. S2-10 TaxID=3373597 RepID=UPI0039778C19
MLKTRLIPTLLLNDIGLVKGHQFDGRRQIGAPLPAVEVYNSRDVDELVIMDIRATRDQREPDYEQIRELAQVCSVPLTVGGGINSLESIRKILSAGADKVLINSAAYDSEDFVLNSVKKFGSQCVVIGIDARRNRENQYECFSHSGTKTTSKNPVQWAIRMEELGVGELMIQNIECDGMLAGYDFDLVKQVSDAVRIPVIASSGARNYSDFLKAITECGASAVAAASLFHFTEQTPMGAKKFLAENGVLIRR